MKRPVPFFALLLLFLFGGALAADGFLSRIFHRPHKPAMTVSSTVSAPAKPHKRGILAKPSSSAPAKPAPSAPKK